MLGRVRRKYGRIKYYLQFFRACASGSDTIVHIGFPYEKDRLTYNVGDPILYYELERMFDVLTGKKHTWVHLVYNIDLDRKWIFVINKFSKLLLIGGHGLMMSDCNYKNSGWLFNVSIKNLQRIKTPMVFFAIGYNPFRRQSPFLPVFNSHVEECVKKALFFSLRNYGSIQCVKNHVSPSCHESIKFQPCPTTMLSLYEDLPHVIQRNEIGICLAFDRFIYRFKIDFDEVIDQLVRYKEHYEQEGYKVTFFVHSGNDLKHEKCKAFNNFGIEVLPLVGLSIDEVYEFYKTKKLIVGMRGHSLMIPFGLRVPCISLTNQDKQKFFMEIIGHVDRNVEVDSTDFYSKLVKETDFILDNYNDELEYIDKMQSEFYNITKNNVEYIMNHLNEDTSNGGGYKALIFSTIAAHATKERRLAA